MVVKGRGLLGARHQELDESDLLQRLGIDSHAIHWPASISIKNGRECLYFKGGRHRTRWLLDMG
jgi:hypothetical protein